VWGEHVAEMTDLSRADRAHLFEVVMATEAALRTLLHPAKINLASFGNMVPHLHWHVIARFDWDSHFPAPVWAAPQRPRAAQPEDALQARLPAMEAQMRQALAQWAG